MREDILFLLPQVILPWVSFCVFGVFFFLQSHKTPWVPLCSYDLIVLIYLTLCIPAELWKPPSVFSRPTLFTHSLPYCSP